MSIIVQQKVRYASAISLMFHLLNMFSCFQRPRVCILGGGFGGLYTALRLESLVWPGNNKPQVK